MHCFVLSGPNGKDSLSIRRSVEVLAYHPGEHRVSILLLLLAHSETDDNAIRLLHRGAVECSVVPSWPLPIHPSEPKASTGILNELYKGLFAKDPASGQLLRVKDLTPWDTEVELPEPEPLWPTTENRQLESDTAGLDGPAPFTTWTVTGLKQGWNLLAFKLTIGQAAYDRRLTEGSSFTVDGPDRILARIEYGELASFTDSVRDQWRSAMSGFVDPETRLQCDSHDIVLLEAPPAAPVARVPELCASGVYIAATRADGSVRYLTTDASFTLPLGFATAVPVGSAEPLVSLAAPS
jgi:hypothetical protein